MRFILHCGCSVLAASTLAACGRVGFSATVDGGAPLVFADATASVVDARGISHQDGSGHDAGDALGRAPDELVLYLFDEGAGGQVRDRSQRGTPLDLNVVDATEIRWVTGGLRLEGSTLISHAGAATKITDACVAGNAVTIEAWITPAQAVVGGPARIATLSLDEDNRNFLLAQGDDSGAPSGHYTFRYRTEDGSDNGRPSFGTTSDASTTTITHLVATYEPGRTRLYVDTALYETTQRVGSLANWDRTYAFAIGDEHDGGKRWIGTLHLVAVYDRVLSPGEVQQNFDRGPDPELGL